MTLKDFVLQVAKENREYTMNLSLRQIQSMVEKNLKVKPSLNTLASILRDSGIETSDKGSHRWVYKHKESHE